MKQGDTTMYDQKFPATDFKKNTYSFTDQELRELMAFDPIVKMGSIAETMMDRILRTIFLKRVMVPDSPDVGILYDIPTRTAVVYTPKIWCSNCLKRQAKFSYMEKPYCQSCVDEIQKSVKQTPIKQEKKPDKKKEEEKSPKTQPDAS